MGQNINIEFVSANPTGPLHAAHARGAILGDGTHAHLAPDILRSIHLSDISAWPRIVANSVKEFSLGACKLCTDPSKAGCARRVLGADFPDIVCYTLEISFYAAPMNNGSALTSQMYKPVPQVRDRENSSSGSNGINGYGNSVLPPCPNTEKGYIEFGKQVGLSFMNYYKIPRTKGKPERRSSNPGGTSMWNTHSQDGS